VELFANRFAITDEGRAIDLSTGREVHLTVTSAGGPSDERRWAVRCDTLRKLHHRSIARLVDYGPVAEGKRFEAWDCGAPWTGARDAARQTALHAATFLDACALSRCHEPMLRQSVTEPIVLPGPTTGYPLPQPRAQCELTLADCGLELASRAGVPEIAELFELGASKRARAIALWGPRGSGVTSAISELARAARLHGIVPIAAALLGSAPGRLIEGRTLFVVADAAATGWRSLVDSVLRSPRPHVVLMAADREITGVDCVSLGALARETLASAVRPHDVPGALRDRIRRAADRAGGCPGRFAQLLWGATPAVGARATTRGCRAAEVPAVYGSGSDSPDLAEATNARPWPAPGELASLRRRVQAGSDLVDRGRHAPGERTLRQATASLARRRDWSHASRAALLLARSMSRRGRSKEAQSALADAREYAMHAGQQDALIDVAIQSGHVWIDRARLDDAETTLGAAVDAARAMGDAGRQAEAAVGMARCLFWQGRFADADLAVNAIGQAVVPDTQAVRLTIAASRNAVGTQNPALAVSLSAAALQRAMKLADPALLARAGCAAAFAHLAVNDVEAVDRDVVLALSAARMARDPLRALRARLLLGEAARRGGRHLPAAALVARLKKLAAVELPAIVKARGDLLAALVANSDDAHGTVKRFVSSSGLPALALFAPAPARPDGWTGDAFVDETVAILRACQNASDEGEVLGDVCRRLRRQLEASAVAIVVAGEANLRPVASDGSRAFDTAIAERAIAAAAPVAPHRIDDRIAAAVPIRYGGETIGALTARWALGTTHALGRAIPLLTMSATAAAPAVGGVRAAQLRPPTPGVVDFVGVGPSSFELRQAVERAAAAPFPVLIEGESGSGKELVARAVHRLSPRRSRPMCTLNCAALPDDLVEAELFGHTRGAFTGAAIERAGVFEEAHGGTLFLDEIGELSPRAQAKVLRVIQEGELKRVGENTSRRVDVRIVTATNRDLRRAAAAGQFRVDLLYRLDVVRIAVAPLRERREDVPVLVEHFWREATARIGSRAVLSAAAVAALARYDWPGNVRELQNVLAALAVRSARRGVVPPAALPPQFGATAAHEGWRLDEARRTFEERFVRAALVRTGGRRGQTAEELGVSRQGLSKLMARLGIDD
jgi:transcriptional regulator with AAA-type ATPase domain